MQKMQLHDLCEAFPPLPAAELDALTASIKANGLLNPIYTYEGKILDGGHRYKACLAAGVEPRFLPYEGDSPDVFVDAQNFHRRGLPTPGQRATTVAKLQVWSKARGHGGDRKSDQVATLPLDRIADRAAKSGASERTQRMADKVAKAAPELAKEVIDGKTTLPAAHAKVTGKPAKKKTAAQMHADARRAEAEKAADEMLEGFDPLVELEKVQAELEDAQALIAKLTASDLQAEIKKLTDANKSLQIRLSTEMDRGVAQQKELTYFGKLFADLRKIAGVKDNRDLKALLQAVTAPQKAAA